jgi:PTS system nitrogen regulatory IIA component
MSSKLRQAPRGRGRRRAPARATSRPAAAPAPSAIRIVDFLRSDAVVADLRGRTRRSVLTELCDPHADELDPAIAVEALLEREKLGSTGFGDGLAVPHARIPGLTRIVASFGRSRAGVEFRALDDAPSCFFFALLTPDLRESEQAAGRQTYANLLARICSLFERRGFRRALSTARDSRAIHRLIVREDDLVRRRRPPGGAPPRSPRARR